MAVDRSIFILDFLHPPKESETLHFHLGEEFWQAEEEPQIIGGEMELELVITTLPSRAFNLDFTYKGYVVVPCDRCLQPLEVPLQFGEEMRVVLGASLDDEDDEQLVLDEQDPTYDFSWIFYELVLVHLPLQMMHKIEDCDPEMIKYLVDGLPVEGEQYEVEDPRWAELRMKLAQQEEDNKSKN